MEAPSLPEGFEAELRSVREGLHLRWNPRAKVVRAGQYDVYGNISKKPVYDGRWELWDHSPEGVEYKVTTLQDEDGNFKPPGRWLIELLHRINPANYGGSVGKMVQAIVDDPNASAIQIGDEEFDDLVDQAAKWVMWATTPKTMVTKDI